jgi:glutamine synthetase
MEEYLRNDGITCQVGAEVECFIFDYIIFENNNNHDNPDSTLKIISSEQFGIGKYPIRRKEGYDVPPFQDSLSDLRFEVADVLTQFYRIDVTNLIHEVASNGQIEINFVHDTLTRTADNVQIYKDVVRNIAKQHNRIANFMPKPIFGPNNSGNGLHSNADSDGDNGSGMHTSISLWNNSGSDTYRGKNNNLFYNESDDYAQLSQTARYFLGGILNHASSLAATVTPTTNSYCRMVPGFEAPIYIAWARGNRSTVIRVPVDGKDHFKSKRIEFRAPDPSANPYLAFSAIVSAGLDGIKKKTDPGNPIDENIYKMSDAKRNSLGIKSLPCNLEDALASLKSDSDYLKICFHKELIETHLILKEEELRKIGENQSKMRQFMLYYDI